MQKHEQYLSGLLSRIVLFSLIPFITFSTGLKTNYTPILNGIQISCSLEWITRKIITPFTSNKSFYYGYLFHKASTDRSDRECSIIQ